jgi:hypothetical protein
MVISVLGSATELREEVEDEVDLRCVLVFMLAVAMGFVGVGRGMEGLDLDG